MFCCLNGKHSTITVEYNPPHELGDGDFEVGLVDLMTYNSIPNIETNKNNLFYYGNKKIALPEGMYELEDLHLFLKHRIYKDCVTDTSPTHNAESRIAEVIDTVAKQEDKCVPSTTFKLLSDKTTMKCKIFCSEEIDFTQPKTIRSLLGFESVKLKPNKWHYSTYPVNISTVDVIRVTCNIVKGSYINDKEGHAIHEFFPQVDKGFKIIEIPRTIIYLPISTNTIHTIIVKLVDQNGDLVNFENENITARLHIRKRM